jgi:hypothetical protein
MSVEIPLTKGYVAIVDDEDADLAEFYWQARIGRSGVVYATRSLPRDDAGKRPLQIMHRTVLERVLSRSLVGKEEVDHVDNNGLNNRRTNLRLATKAQNMANRRANANSTVVYKGVRVRPGGKSYDARIRVDGRSVFLGNYPTPELAHTAYIAAALEHYGPYANDGTQSLAHIAQAQQESRS